MSKTNNPTQSDSAQILSALFDNAREFIGLLDTDGTLRRVNDTALRAADIARENVVGRPFWETVWWKHSSEMQDRLQQAVRRAAKGEPDQFDATHPSSTNEMIDVEFFLTPVSDDDGQVVFIIAEGRDVTRRKLAERQLEEYNKSLQRKIDTQKSEMRRTEADAKRVFVDRIEVEEALLTVGRIIDESLNEIYIFDAETLKFILVNRGGRENTGYTIEELGSLTPVDLKPAYDYEKFEKLIEPLRSGSTGLIQFETFHRRKDGTDYAVNVHLQMTTFQGRQAFLAIILDTTEQRRAEARLEAILETAVDAIITIDEMGHIETVNSAATELFQYTAAELVGKNINILMPSPYCEQHDGYLHRYIATGEKKIIGVGREVLGLRKDGTTFAISLAVSEVQLPDRRIFTGIIHDLTDLKETQQKLMQADRLAAIGQMLSAIAHESRNALQRIQAGVDVLHLEFVEGSKPADQLLRIEKAKDDLQQLLDDLRNFAAPIRLQTTSHDVSTIWNQAWANLEPLRSGRSCTLHEPEPSVSLICKVDAFRLEQVFRNIMQNSLEACVDPVDIHIEASKHVGADQLFAKITISDNGPGIPPDMQAQIFQPFFTTKQTGTGLGMAIAQRILDAHGGTIGIEGSLKRGLSIQLMIPMSTDQN